MPMPPGLSTGAGLVRLVRRRRAGPRQPDLLRRDRRLPGRSRGHHLDLDATLSNKGRCGHSIHPDQHAIAFEPGNPNTIYIGNDGGPLPQSTDRGITWQHCNNGLVISEFEYLAQDSARRAGSSAARRTTAPTAGPARRTWTHVADGDGGRLRGQPHEPTDVFHTYLRHDPGASRRPAAASDPWRSSPPTRAGARAASSIHRSMQRHRRRNTSRSGGERSTSRATTAPTWTRLPFPSAATASAMYIPNPDTYTSAPPTAGSSGPHGAVGRGRR